MSILEKIEKRVDRVISQKEKEEVGEVIRYRNQFIKDVENYIQARSSKEDTKEYKKQILTTFKLFEKELKKEPEMIEEDPKETTTDLQSSTAIEIQKYIAVNEVVNKL